MFMILMSGRQRYGDGRVRIWPSGSLLKISSIEFRCQELATINGVHLHNRNGRGL